MINLRINSTLFLILGLLSLAGVSCQSSSQQASDYSPNFLFISIDDLNIYTSLSTKDPGNFLKLIYPDSQVFRSVTERLTPHLSNLADHGLTFTRAYSPAPLCGPSRTALMTGIPPHISGYHSHLQHFRRVSSLEEVTTLPEYLSQNGYYTLGIGKVFHHSLRLKQNGIWNDWPDSEQSWDQWIETDIGITPAKQFDLSVTETLSEYWEQPEDGTGAFRRFGTTSLDRSFSNDFQNAQFISTLLSEKEASIIDFHLDKQSVSLPSDQPYFLACGLFAPHLPWIVPQEYLDLFPLEEMAISEELLQIVRDDLEDLAGKESNSMIKDRFRLLLEHGKTIRGEFGEIEAWKVAIQHYLAMIAWSDQNLGLLTEAYLRLPVQERPVLLLWSDHGYHTGDKFTIGKMTLWEAGNHCTLLIADPRQSDSGMNTSALVSLQDLYPTIVSLAGLNRPEHIYGRDLSPLLKNPHDLWNTPILNCMNSGAFAVRSDSFRYIRFGDMTEELYHVTADPMEYHNLAQDSSYQQPLEAHRSHLTALLAENEESY